MEIVGLPSMELRHMLLLLLLLLVVLLRPALRFQSAQYKSALLLLLQQEELQRQRALLVGHRDLLGQQLRHWCLALLRRHDLLVPHAHRVRWRRLPILR
jgi:hypothetical protein